MKLSKYSFVIKRGSDYVLYNCWTEKMAVLEDRLREWLESGDVDHIQDIHPEFYDYLLREQFIVDNEVNEAEEVIKKWKEEEEKGDSLNIIVNSTLDCNMRCWYCYEKHRENTNLTSETISALLNLIRKKVARPELKRVHIAFFGGEPLLSFEQSVWPLLFQADELCVQHCKLFSTSFVTNSYLLSENIISQLETLHLCNTVSFQITLDGNEELHDKVRHLASGKGSYQRILSNIRMVLQHKMPVTLRLNCTGYNIRTFVDVVSDLKNLPQEDKNFVTIDFQRVWQDAPRTDVDMPTEQKKLRELFLQERFRVNELKHIDISRCYADKANDIVVNYNGDLYKCTARDFIPENSEGKLLPDGEMRWNEKRKLREQLKYGNQACMACRIYPLCHGSCSQVKIEAQGQSGCIRNYSDIYKTKVIRDRVDFLLESYV